MADNKLPYHTMIHMLTIKLSSSTYMLWKTQVSHILRSQQLLGFLDGTTACPPLPVPPPPPSDPVASASVTAKAAFDAAVAAREAWIAEDQRLCGLLFSSLSEEAMAEVIGCSSAQSIWDTLSSVYQNRSRSSILQLRDQVLNLRKSGTVHDLHLQFKAIFDRLASMGSATTNDDQVLWFLRALGSEFQAFSAPVMNQTPAPLYVDVVAQAENHEAFLRSLSGSVSSASAGAVAFTAASQPSSDSIHSQQAGRGYGNFSYRHNKSDGRRGGKGQGRGRPKCQWCGKLGHLASTCFKLVPPPQKQASSAHLADVFQSSLQLEPHTRDSDWYVDSGATNHMASSSASLENVSVYSEQGHQGGRGNRSH